MFPLEEGAADPTIDADAVPHPAARQTLKVAGADSPCRWRRSPKTELAEWLAQASADPPGAPATVLTTDGQPPPARTGADA